MISVLTKMGRWISWPHLGGRPPDAVVAFDVGTNSVKSALVEWSGGCPVIKGVYHGDRAEVGPWAAKDWPRHYTAVCGVNGYGVRAAFHDLPRLSAKDTATVMARVVEREHGSDCLYDWSVESSESGGMKALVVAASAELVKRAVSEMGMRGVNVDAVFADISSLCECLRFVEPETTNTVVAVFALGHTWSHFAVVDRGKMVFARLIKLGVSSLVSSVASVCAIDESEAREAIFTTTVQASSLPEAPAERGRAEALRAAIERVSNEMLRSIAFACKRMGASPPGKVFVTGGGALIPGLAQTLGSISGLETAVLNPLTRMNADCDAEAIQSGPLYCVVIGQALLTRRQRPPNLMPAELRARRNRIPRLALALSAMSVALIYIVFAAIALDSTAQVYRRAVEAHGAHRPSGSGALGAAEDGQQAMREQEARLAYSLVVKPQPNWADVIKGVSNAVPPGVLLDSMAFSRETSGERAMVEWRVEMRGAIVDPEHASVILDQMRDGLEESGPLTDVQVIPVGSTTVDMTDKRIEGAIVFEIRGMLE